MTASPSGDQQPDRPRRLMDLFIMGAIFGLSGLFTAAFFLLMVAIRS
jgi:hypothetical protein